MRGRASCSKVSVVGLESISRCHAVLVSNIRVHGYGMAALPDESHERLIEKARRSGAIFN